MRSRVGSRLSHFFNLSSVADASVTGTAAGPLASPEPIVGAYASSPDPGLPASPGASGYGTTGRAILLGPGQFNWDVAIAKKTQIDTS